MRMLQKCHISNESNGCGRFVVDVNNHPIYFFVRGMADRGIGLGVNSSH